ncbi:hypothetical protein ACHAO4_002802 [Trichoderma viride]
MAQTLKAKRPRTDESLPDHISNRAKSSGTPRELPSRILRQLVKDLATRRALRELDRRNENLPLSNYKPAVEFVKPRGAKLAALAKLGISERAQFAASGGLDLSHLKGFPEPANVTHSMASPLLPLNRDTARTSAYDDNFAQHCAKYCIYLPRHKFPDGRRSPNPNYFGEIREALKQRRPSLSPYIVPETAHEDFLEKLPGATKGDLVRRLIPLLVGNADIPNSGNCHFTNLISRTEYTTVTPVPDYFEGTLLEDVDVAPGGQPGCHTTLLRAYALNNEEAYSIGREAFRSLSLRAKDVRDRFIATANARARRQNTVDEGMDDGSTKRGDNFSRAGEEQQDQGSSPLDFYDNHTFIEPGEGTRDASQNTTQDSQLTNAGLALEYDTDNTEVGVEGTSSFTSVV